MFKRFWWIFPAMAATCAIAGLVAAAVAAYVMPKKYESQAIIELPMNPSGEAGPGMTPQIFGTEFEKIKSQNSLEKVVENLELVNKWGVDKDAAIRILKNIVTSENIRGTDLISIKVRHTNREDARDIAAEVAKTYGDYRKEADKRLAEQTLLELRKANDDLERKVEERRKDLAKRLREAGIIYHEGTPPLPERDYPTEKRELESDQALLQTMKLNASQDEMAAKLKGSGIIIHEEPQIAQSPVSPNVPLVLITGTVGGILISPLLALALIFILHRMNPVRMTGPPSLPQ